MKEAWNVAFRSDANEHVSSNQTWYTHSCPYTEKFYKVLNWITLTYILLWLNYFYLYSMPKGCKKTRILVTIFNGNNCNGILWWCRVDCFPFVIVWWVWICFAFIPPFFQPYFIVVVLVDISAIHSWALGLFWVKRFINFQLANAYLQIHVCVRTRMYACVMLVFVCVSLCLCVCECVYTLVCECMYKHWYTFKNVYVCMYICMHAHMHILTGICICMYV